MYSKIQVNTPSAIPVVKSDTYNIPNPGNLVFQGTDSSHQLVQILLQVKQPLQEVGIF